MPYPSALKRFHQITFMPQVVTLPQIPGCLSKRPTSSPAAAPWGSFQRGGRSPLFVSFEGEVQEGETEIPLLACLLDRARPVFSTGRKWGAHMPSHHHGCHFRVQVWTLFTLHCAPAATAAPNTASAGGHWPPWPEQRHHPPPGSKAPWPGSGPYTAPPAP